MPDVLREHGSKLRVMVVDDHPIVREGVRRRVEREPDMTVCCEAGDSAEAMNYLDDCDCDCDVAVIDISMAGRSGLELVKDIRARGLGFPILILSIHDDVSYAERALAAGAQGYVLKQEAPPIIIEALRRVLSGEVFVGPRMASKLLSRFVGASRWSERRPIDRLSDRELEVLGAVGEGRGTRQIADELSLSISSIETYKTRIKEKLGLESAAELAAFAAKWIGGTRG